MSPEHKILVGHARELKAPRGQAFHSETCFPEFASNAGRRGVLENTNDPLNPVAVTTYTENDDVKGKGKKTGQTTVPFLSVPPSSVSQSQTILCSVFTALGRTKYICMNEVQNKNCVILVILHISSMLLYFHLKLALHNIKMNSKIHANNLKN